MFRQTRLNFSMGVIVITLLWIIIATISFTKDVLDTIARNLGRPFAILLFIVLIGNLFMAIGNLLEEEDIVKDIFK